MSRQNNKINNEILNIICLVKRQEEHLVSFPHFFPSKPEDGSGVLERITWVSSPYGTQRYEVTHTIRVTSTTRSRPVK